MHFSILLGYFFVILGFMLALALVFKIFREHQAPSTKIAWLVTIVTLPFIGVPLYLLFGGRKARRKAKRKSPLQLHAPPEIPLAQAPELDNFLRRYELPGASTGNQLTFHTNGQDMFQALTRIITSARERLYVATFILGTGDTGTRIVEMLTAKAAEGVDVRLLLDDVGSRQVSSAFLAPLLAAGGKVAFFMPVLRSPVRAMTANLRNHRKLVVADEAHALMGGANLAAEYLGPFHNPDRWKDVMVEVQGPQAWVYADLFRSDWQFASPDPLLPQTSWPKTPQAADLANAGSSIMQVIPSGPDVVGDPLHDAILTMLFHATHRVWVVSPYFIVDTALSQAFALAARRRVDVRIAVPLRSDNLLADLCRASQLRSLQKAGCKILPVPGTNLHAKALLVDSTIALVGSANMDWRSMFYNYEAMGCIYSKEDVQTLEDWYTSITAHALRGVPPVSPVRDILDGALALFSPLI